MPPRTRTRYQVLVEDETRAHVQALAEQKGLAESAMCRLLIKEALELAHNKLEPVNDPKSPSQTSSLDEIRKAKIGRIMELAAEHGLI